MQIRNTYPTTYAGCEIWLASSLPTQSIFEVPYCLLASLVVMGSPGRPWLNTEFFIPACVTFLTTKKLVNFFQELLVSRLFSNNSWAIIDMEHSLADWIQLQKLSTDTHYQHSSSRLLRLFDWVCITLKIARRMNFLGFSIKVDQCCYSVLFLPEQAFLVGIQYCVRGCVHPVLWWLSPLKWRSPVSNELTQISQDLVLQTQSVVQLDGSLYWCAMAHCL